MASPGEHVPVIMKLGIVKSEIVEECLDSRKCVAVQAESSEPVHQTTGEWENGEIVVLDNAGKKNKNDTKEDLMRIMNNHCNDYSASNCIVTQNQNSSHFGINDVAGTNRNENVFDHVSISKTASKSNDGNMLQPMAELLGNAVSIQSTSQQAGCDPDDDVLFLFEIQSKTRQPQVVPKVESPEPDMSISENFDINQNQQFSNVGDGEAKKNKQIVDLAQSSSTTTTQLDLNDGEASQRSAGYLQNSIPTPSTMKEGESDADDLFILFENPRKNQVSPKEEPTNSDDFPHITPLTRNGHINGNHDPQHSANSDELVYKDLAPEVIRSVTHSLFPEIEQVEFVQSLSTQNKSTGNGQQQSSSSVANVYAPQKPEQNYCSSSQDILQILKYYKKNKKGDLSSKKESLNVNSAPTMYLSQKGRYCIYYENQLYRPKRSSGKDDMEVCVAQCTFRSEDPCLGRISIFVSTGEVKDVDPCNHETREDDISQKILIQQAVIDRLRGADSRTSYKNLKRKANEMVVVVPKKNTVSRYVNRKVLPNAHKTFPPTISWSSDCPVDVKCLLDTSGDPGPNILGWNLDKSEKFLENVEVIHVDGLMSKLPKGYLQLLTICVEKTDMRKVVPIAFFLMNRKTLDAYKMVFECLRNNGMNPKVINSDFEISIADGANMIFGNLTVYYCTRHLKVSWARKLREIVGVKIYKGNEMQEFLRRAYCLVFCPINKISEYYIFLDALSKNVSDKLTGFMTYLNSNYVGHGRMPRYNPSVWNASERLRDKKDITNNLSESLNAMYTRSIKGTDCKMALTCIDKSSEVMREIYEDIENGQCTDYSNKKRQFTDQQLLKDIQRDYSSPSLFFGTLRHHMTVPSLY